MSSPPLASNSDERGLGSLVGFTGHFGGPRFDRAVWSALRTGMKRAMRVPIRELATEGAGA